VLDVTLVDYGVGNIHSLKKALEEAGARVSVADRLEEVLRAKALLLPGVGAFGKVASMLAPIRGELKARLEDGLPALCVCVGMQILYESSDEGSGEGLGFLPGRVRRLGHERLPHIGWNSVRHPAPASSNTCRRKPPSTSCTPTRRRPGRRRRRHVRLWRPLRRGRAAKQGLGGPVPSREIERRRTASHPELRRARGLRDVTGRARHGVILGVRRGRRL